MAGRKEHGTSAHRRSEVVFGFVLDLSTPTWHLAGLKSDISTREFISDISVCTHEDLQQMPCGQSE